MDGMALRSEGMKEIDKDDQKRFFGTLEFTGRARVSKFYAVVKSSREYYEKFLFANAQNKKVLEYGCGTGSYAFSLARHGAKVVGIDIAELALKLAKGQAKDEGLENITFMVTDAEAMPLADNSFDMVCGTGILHHLNMDRALRELTAVLRPEAKAIFIEPMGHNPLINLFRKLTPHLRTKDEHPLTVHELSSMARFFQKAHCEFFHVFSLLAVPFRDTRLFSPLLRVLDSLDRQLFKWMPFARMFAWQAVVVLEGPKKAPVA